MDNESVTPMTWNSEGKLVVLDESERARQRAIGDDLAAKNPPLKENRMLSGRETLNLMLLDVAHMLDSIVRPPDYLPLVVAAQPPLIALFVTIFLLRMAWMVFVPVLLMVIAFRLWVWYRIEKPGFMPRT